MTELNLEEALQQEDQPTTDFERVNKIAKDVVELQQQIADLEAQQKELKKTYNKLTLEILPEAMGPLTSLELADGTKVECRNEVQASITNANKPMAFRWLNENGYGGIVKASLQVAFSDSENAQEFIAEHSDELPEDFELKESIHAATLKSFVKERLASGENLPLDIFSIHQFKQAKVNRGK